MDNKAEFIKIFEDSIARPGAKELLDYIKSTSFFEDPASTKYHLCCEGGLCEHSLHVYKRLVQLAAMRKQELRSTGNIADSENLLSDESVAVVSLLHDLCKAGVYVKELKNRKTYDPETVRSAQSYLVKHDAGGDFVWETVAGYSFSDPLPYGHGEKSVFLIQKFMPLTDAEAFAIRYHMSSWQEGDNKNNISRVFESNVLAFLLHTADEFATYLDEA